MATLNINTVPSNTNVTVQNSNNIVANIQSGNEVNVQVIPTPKQVVQINRGVAGKDGGDKIGGYPVSVTGAQQYDVLMFGVNEWVNTPQTEIADGGNF
jgi:hypothetical protein